MFVNILLEVLIDCSILLLDVPKLEVYRLGMQSLNDMIKTEISSIIWFHLIHQSFLDLLLILQVIIVV